MIVSSFVGIYKGMVPLVIFIIPIALSLGWDYLTGLGMSLLPLAFGFAAAVTNPLLLIALYNDTGKRKRTVRIYISWNEKLKKVIVGWIGKHLYLP